MKTEKPSFFLSTASESEGLSTPRACWALARLRSEERDDHMLVRIDPPVPGPCYGLGIDDVARLVLTGRYQDLSLFPPSRWPLPVMIAHVLDPAIGATRLFTKDQVRTFALGTIFPTIEQANAYVERLR